MAGLLLAQLGTQGRALGAQATQFGFLLLTLGMPGQGGLAGDLPLVLEQFALAPLGRQLGLLVGLDLADLGEFLAAFIELRTQTGLGQLGTAQALLQQAGFELRTGRTPLQRPGQRQQRHAGDGQAEQQRR
ncbi:hypothetical protein D3C85_162790 [compost metagenome]